MRVLVTGGMGFIGRYVVEELQARGKVPLIFDHMIRLPGDYPEGVEVITGDIRDGVAVSEAMAHADGWIHLAAVLGTQETIDNPLPAAQTNLDGGLNMLEAAARYGLPGVYIGVGNHWMNNTYSISKTMIERFVDMYNNHRGTAVNIVRVVNAYGPRQLAAAPYGPGKVRKITPSFVCRALHGDPIEIYGDGEQVSDMVYVTDVARALVAALEAADEGRVFPKAFEVGPVESRTVNEVAETIIRLAESTSDIVHLPMRPGEIPGSQVVAEWQTLGALGINANTDFVLLEEGMRRTIEYFRQDQGLA